MMGLMKMDRAAFDKLSHEEKFEELRKAADVRQMRIKKAQEDIRQLREIWIELEREHNE